MIQDNDCARTEVLELFLSVDELSVNDDRRPNTMIYHDIVHGSSAKDTYELPG
jgi:hypothetical protein